MISILCMDRAVIDQKLFITVSCCYCCSLSRFAMHPPIRETKKGKPRVETARWLSSSVTHSPYQQRPNTGSNKKRPNKFARGEEYDSRDYICTMKSLLRQ